MINKMTLQEQSELERIAKEEPITLDYSKLNAPHTKRALIVSAIVISGLLAYGVHSYMREMYSGAVSTAYSGGS